MAVLEMTTRYKKDPNKAATLVVADFWGLLVHMVIHGSISWKYLMEVSHGKTFHLLSHIYNISMSSSILISYTSYYYLYPYIIYLLLLPLLNIYSL